ncbi:hypothetical protein D9613_003471 [Agrocybe pediades]|uniref:Uncharacterized protein n=1 Tax=Agrocybe pediades TaxID=84607 RepID=A0A8H4QRH8_9AGAR|nr:hypothetical protein D9613_003471 [Agrocybe pediades]
MHEANSSRVVFPPNIGRCDIKRCDLGATASPKSIFSWFTESPRSLLQVTGEPAFKLLPFTPPSAISDS